MSSIKKIIQTQNIGIIRRTKINKNVNQLKEFIKLIKSVANINNKYLVAYRKIKEINSCSVIIDTDYYMHGDIFNLTCRSDYCSILNQITQICIGLSILHSKAEHYHGYLKPSNILQSENGTILLSQYFEYEYFENDSYNFNYLSKEQLMGKDVTFKCDSYNMGLIIYKLFTGVDMFHFISIKERVEYEDIIKENQIKHLNCDECLKSIISYTVCDTAENRLSIDDILERMNTIENKNEFIVNKWDCEIINNYINKYLIQNMNILYRLCIKDNDLSDNHEMLFKNLPKHLKSLHLINCSINCEIFNNLSLYFSNITCLNELNVSCNNITVLEKSSKNITKLKYLVDLNISNNLIDEENIHFLVNSLAKLKYISYLDLSHSSIGKIEDLISSLVYLSSLKQLKIHSDYVNKRRINCVLLNNSQFHHLRKSITSCTD